MDISWAWIGHVLGIGSRPSWQNGVSPERDGFRFFRAPGLSRHFWSSYMVTVKRKHLPRCPDLTWVTSGCKKFELISQRGTWKFTELAEGGSPDRDGIRFFRAPGLLRHFWSSKRVTVKRKHVHKCEDLTFVVFGYQKCCLEGQKC